MCDCISKITETSLNKLKERNEGKAYISGGMIAQSAFFFDGTTKTYNDFEYKLTPIKKDGTDGKKITKTVSLIHSYCPFCGEKHPTE